MSAEHPTDVAAYVAELDAFRRRVVAEAEALPLIQPTVELTQAETDQLCSLLARVRGALSFYRDYEQADEDPYGQALDAALADLTGRKQTARERAHQATIERDRAYVLRTYQQRWHGQRDLGPQRDDRQGGGADGR
jgi:hypothetical protein